MPTTIRDAQEAIMKGKSRYLKWRQEFQKNWKQPDVELEMAKFWASIPAPVKEWYKQNKPEIYNKMNQGNFGGE